MSKDQAASRAINAIKSDNEQEYIGAMRDLYALLSDDERQSEIARMESALGLL